MMKADPETLFSFQLAEKLNKTVAEIRQMPLAEYRGWMAYILASRESR